MDLYSNQRIKESQLSLEFGIEIQNFRYSRPLLRIELHLKLDHETLEKKNYCINF